MITYRTLGWIVFGVLFAMTFGVWYALVTQTRTEPPAHLAITTNDQNPPASRARYLNATGSLDRAWGDWSILLVRRDGQHEVIVGLSKEECVALRPKLVADIEIRWTTSCYDHEGGQP